MHEVKYIQNHEVFVVQNGLDDSYTAIVLEVNPKSVLIVPKEFYDTEDQDIKSFKVDPLSNHSLGGYPCQVYQSENQYTEFKVIEQERKELIEEIMVIGFNHLNDVQLREILKIMNP